MMCRGVPVNDLQNSLKRLDIILSSPRLIFNPYTVSDERLLYIVENADWGGMDDIVEAVVLTFTRLNPVEGLRRFNGIFVRQGNRPGESFIPTSALVYGATAFDSVRPARCSIGKQRITNAGHVESLVGKRVFVSRAIRGRAINGDFRRAYKMTRLKGNVAKDAEAIRAAMCEAKIEMLQRVIDYPEWEYHLNCSRDFFDYRTRILQAINIIRSWSPRELANE